MAYARPMAIYLVPYHLDEPFESFAVPQLDLAERTIRHGLPDGKTWERLAALYDKVAGAVEGADRPIVVSGDCTTSLGILTGVQRKGLDPAIVWFDAHGDFNTDETTVSGYL